MTVSSSEAEGSWLPFFILAALAVFRWIYAGDGAAIRIRRFFTTKVRSIVSSSCLVSLRSYDSNMVIYISVAENALTLIKREFKQRRNWG